MALWAPAQNLSVVFSANGSEARMRGMWRRRDSVVVRTASSEVSSSGGGEMAAYEEGQLERPNWAGETPLSRLVGAIISFKPLYSVLKLGARQVLIRSFLLSLSLSGYWENVGREKRRKVCPIEFCFEGKKTHWNLWVSKLLFCFVLFSFVFSATNWVWLGIANWVLGFLRLFVAWLPGKCEKKKWKLKRFEFTYFII